MEIPGDGGAWWATVYGVAQSRTRLKRLSSSSCSAGDLGTQTCQAPAVEHCYPLPDTSVSSWLPLLWHSLPPLASLSLLQTYLGSGSKHRTSIPACNGSWALGYLERTEYLFFGQKPKKTPIIVFKWAKTKAVLKNREGAKGNGQKYLQEGGSSIL